MFYNGTHYTWLEWENNIDKKTASVTNEVIATTCTAFVIISGQLGKKMVSGVKKKRTPLNINSKDIRVMFSSLLTTDELGTNGWRLGSVLRLSSISHFTHCPKHAVHKSMSSRQIVWSPLRRVPVKVTVYKISQLKRRIPKKWTKIRKLNAC